MLGCLVWWLLAFRPHAGQPALACVLVLICALHAYPHWLHFHATLLLQLAATVSGVLSPLASQSHSAATSG